MKTFRTIRKEGLGRVALVAGLATWIAVLPVFQQLHYLFADHDHVLCVEHHQIEAVGPRADGSEAQPRHSEQTSSGVSANDHDRQSPTTHTACQVASVGVKLAVTSTATPPCLPAVTEHETRPDFASRILPILATAPKQSPPALVRC